MLQFCTYRVFNKFHKTLSDLSKNREASLHSAIDWQIFSNVFHTGVSKTRTSKAQHVVLMHFEAGQKKFDFLQNLTGQYFSLSKTFVLNYIPRIHLCYPSLE